MAGLACSLLVLDENRAPMGPDFLPNSGNGVWKGSSGAFPDSISAGWFLSALESAPTTPAPETSTQVSGYHFGGPHFLSPPPTPENTLLEGGWYIGVHGQPVGGVACMISWTLGAMLWCTTSGVQYMLCELESFLLRDICETWQSPPQALRWPC